MSDETEKRILVVDDEQDVLNIFKELLESAGYDVVCVLSGKAALKEVDLHNFDLVILDIMMPDITGWDLFTHIVEVKPSLKVIFLSVVYITDARLKELKDSGVKDYITKPFDKDDLLKRVKKVFAK